MKGKLRLVILFCLLAPMGSSVPYADAGREADPSAARPSAGTIQLDPTSAVAAEVVPSAAPPFADLRGHLDRPVQGTVIGGFGPQRWHASATYVRHPGVTYQVQPDADIRAAAPGVVQQIGEMDGFGWVVILHHGSRYYTIYAFSGDCLVLPGETIGQHGLLGRSTGQSQPPSGRVYFEIRHGERPLDPAAWIDLN